MTGNLDKCSVERMKNKYNPFQIKLKSSFPQLAVNLKAINTLKEYIIL